MKPDFFSEEQLRHSASHLLAQAIDELFPGTIFTLGPATEAGFFYDILPMDRNFKNEDLDIISQRMKEIVKRDLKIEHNHVSKEEAKKLFSKNIFKQEIINTQIKADFAGIAKQGNFIDLCKGGHVPSTKYLEHFELTGISGSYWRGNRDGQALQRISGVIFKTKKELEEYLQRQKDLELYDHRRLGNEMDLFSLRDEGVGFPFIHPKGMIIINEMVSYMRELTSKNYYQEVRTPTILSRKLWERSGHCQHYSENMYTLKIDNEIHAVKPMNCPGMFLIYNSRPRSYRELPLRLSEFGHVHRCELSGVLHGLTRVRAFTQDDAHFFCRLSQLEDEILMILSIIDIVMKKAGLLNTQIVITTKPSNASGSAESWEIATNSLMQSLKRFGKDFEISEGDGAFYGPKIEIRVKDNFDRVWTCGTIQVDFVQPENFDMTYINEKGEKERPVVIHQAIYGSLERFFAILLEHHKGHLPFWLAPTQIKILPITDLQHEYSKKVSDFINSNGKFRVLIDESSDPLPSKIQRAQKERIPVMIIIGKKEQIENIVSLRFANGTQKNSVMQDELIKILKEMLN
jgi:threonyl-tRNA synthetase